MKQFARIVAVLALVLAAIVLAPAASATSGTLVITSNTTLTEDHSGAIIVARNGITLDCAGHSITGAGSGSGPGVYLPGTKAATVTNCTITNFDFGVLLEVAHGNTLKNNSAMGNHDRGFHLEQSSRNTLASNSTDSNAVHGVAAVGGGENVFKENSAEGNGASGFSIILSDDNTLMDNVAADNEVAGFSIQSSSKNTAKNNISSGNTLYGFVLNPFANGAQPTNNLLAGNVADDNGWYGLFVSDASFNRITGNAALSNGIFDAAQEGAASGNVWIDNTFGTTFGI